MANSSNASTRRDELLQSATRPVVMEALEQRQLMSGVGTENGAALHAVPQIASIEAPAAERTSPDAQAAHEAKVEAAAAKHQLKIQTEISKFESHITAEVHKHLNKASSAKFQAHIAKEQAMFAKKIAKQGGTYTPIDFADLLVGAAAVAAPVLTGTVASATQINLTWTTVTGASTYTVQVSNNGGAVWSTLTSTANTTYNNTALTADSAHQYRVTATKTGKTSLPSNVLALTTLLNAPTGFKAAAVSTTRINLSWIPVTHATGYKIERSLNNSTWTALAPTPALAGTASSYADTTGSAGTTYYYRISGIDAAGTSAATAAATVLTLPAAPVLAAVVASSSQINLTWVAITGAASYKVEKSTDGGSTWATLASPTAATYSHTALAADSSFKYRVTAINATGPSALSNVISATTLLNAPTGFTATAVSATRMNLAWIAVTDANNYKIERSPDGTTGWTTITASPALTGASVAYADTTVLAGTTYYYRLSAINAAGASAPSAVTHALTLAASPVLTATLTAPTTAGLSWTIITGATSYLVERSTDGGNSWSTLGSPTALTYSNTGLANDSSYKYRVSAVNARGTSPASNVITLNTVLAAPAGLAAVAVSATQINLSWTPLVHVVTFKLERSLDQTTWTTLTPSPALNSLSDTYSDTGVIAGTTYYYRLSGTNTAGTSVPATAVHALTFPATPVLTATPASATSVNLSWLAITGAATYKVESSNDGGNTWATLGTPTAITYSNTGLTADTSYQYRVSATNATGTSAPSTVVTTTTLLAAPTGLAATAVAATQINLTWNPSLDATGYKIERSLDQTTWTTQTPASPLAGSAGSFSDTTVLAGTTYYYRISAINTRGTSAAATAVHALTFPARPVLTATVFAATQVNLSWLAITGAASYTVERSADAGNTWSTLSPSPTGITFTNTGLTADTAYQYRVSAVNAGGTSTPSIVASVTTFLTSPTGFAATAVSPTEIDMAWSALPDATSYKIETSTNQTTWTTLAPSPALNANSVSYAATGLTAGTTYYYRLSGVDTAGTSAPTAVAHALTFAAAPTLTATPTSATQINLSWLAMPSATSYVLESSSDGGVTWGTLVTQATLTYSNTGLTADTAYKYRVSAINPSGTSPTSTVITSTTILGAPTNFTVTTASATQITLGWKAVTDATNYKIERSPDGTAWTTITAAPALAGTSSSYTDTGLTAGTTYYYRLSAINTSGTSVASTAAHTITFPATPVVTAALVSSTQINLSWLAISSATSYTVELSSDGGSTWSVLASPTTITYSAVSLSPDTAYKIRVSAVNAAGSSVASIVVSQTTPPAAPAGFSATPSTTLTSEVDLAWTPVTHATNYKIERSTDNATWTTVSPATPLVGTSATYADTGLLAGTNYFYRISTIDSVGTSAVSGTVTGLTIPAVPTLTATATSSTTMNVSWTASKGATSYLLEESSDGQTHWTTSSTQTTTTFTDTGLTANSLYEYRVTAINATGNAGPCAPVTQSTLQVAPSAFTVTASTTSPTEIDLAWTFPANAIGYKIERSLNGTTWNTLTQSPVLFGSDQAYADTTVSAGTTYFYRMSTVNSGGTGAPTTAASALTIPRTPTLNGTLISATQANFSWTSALSATSYLLEQSIDSGTHWTTAVSQTGTVFSDTALTADTAYEFRVSAINSTGPGGTSNVDNITTLPAAPTGFTVTPSTTVATEIDLAWTDVTHATTYKIERSPNNSTWTTLVPATPLTGTDAAYADTNVTAGTTFYYRISTTDTVGNSAPTTAASGLTIPPTPTLTSTVASATVVNLSWTAAKSATSYLLEKSVDGGTHFTSLSTQSATTFSDTGLTADTAYQYRVSGINATGSSATSTVATPTTILAAPAGFTVTASSSVTSEIDLAWTTVTDATGYKIERSPDGAIWSTLSPSPALAGTAAAYADTGLLAGTTYYYRISSVNTVGTSVATTAASALTLPATPALTATVTSATTVKLSWTTIKSATSYLVEHSVDAGTHWTSVTSQTATTFTDGGLTADTPYQWRVSAINATGASATSNVPSLTTLLPAPTGFTVTTTSLPNEIDLSWTAVTDATGYKIERSLNQTTWTTLVPSPALAGTDASYHDTSLTGGTQYYYRMSATNTLGASATTTPAGTLTVPSSPVLATTTKSSTSLGFSWSAPIGATSYLLEKSIDAGTHWTSVSTQTGTTFTDTGLTADTSYEYQVTAIDASGNSAPSTASTVSTIVAVPTGFGATASTTVATEIDLAWTAVTDATGYLIERSQDQSTWATIAPSPALAGTAATYADTSALAGSTYYYRISAVGAAGTSVPATVASALTIPATPTLTATVPSATQINLSWTPSLSASSYLVEQSVDTGSHWTSVTSVSATSYNVTGLTADTAYEYRVSAVNATGASATSTVVSPSTLLLAPAGFTVTGSASTAGEIDLAWTAVTDATGYVIERTDVNQIVWTTLPQTPALAGTAAAFADTTALAGSTYYYRISTVGTAGTSAPTSGTSGLTLAPVPTLSASTISTTEIDLSWTPVQSATSYLLETSVDAGTHWASLTSTSGTVFANTGLTADTSYQYRVSAINATGTSAASSVTTMNTLLAAPAGLTATAASATEVDLAWTAVTDATGYLIERSDTSSDWTPLTQTPALAGTAAAFADTTGVANTAYSYRISAIGTAGTSVPSTVATATTFLVAPTGLAATAVSTSQIKLTWTADTDPGLVSFTLQGSSDGSTGWADLVTVDPTATSISDVRLTHATTYYYRLVAVNSGGNSAPSAVVHATTL